MVRFFFGASGSIMATGDYTAKRQIWEGEKTPNKYPLFNGLIWVKIKPFRYSGGGGDDEPEAGPMNVHDLHPQVQEFAAADGTVLLVYLFGSRASGQAGPGSDYDLGILLDRREAAPARRARLTHELVVILGTSSVDVVFLNQAPPELAFAVIQGPD
jgi:predicted nucleotidyltransferase